LRALHLPATAAALGSGELAGVARRRRVDVALSLDGEPVVNIEDAGRHRLAVALRRVEPLRAACFHLDGEITGIKVEVEVWPGGEVVGDGTGHALGEWRRVKVGCQRTAKVHVTPRVEVEVHVEVVEEVAGFARAAEHLG